MKTILDWSAYRNAGMGDAYADIPSQGDDFARAVSVCINSRQCEKSGKGVMCPSFRSSAESDLSTGGRIRLLKQALNSGDLPAALADTRLERSMELCLACKGCKRECENEVDMAMLKVEYLAQLYQQRKPSMRTRLLANLSGRILYYACFKKLIRLRNRFPLLAKLSELSTGLSAKRRLPEPVKHSFTSQSFNTKRNQPLTVSPALAEVVLLVDTFTDNFMPGNAEAAMEVLQQAGYKVFVAEPAAHSDDPTRPLCCGRTHIAHGLVTQARQEASRMLEVLLPHVEAGRMVIGLEPACLLAIRDDYRFLGLGQAADIVAKHAVLFEEFIAREISAHRFSLKFHSCADKGTLLVHGHCHQKAVGAMKSMRKVLKQLPDLDFRLIESSCCGMAGSFGLEKEHAEMAMQMAEQKLVPELNKNVDAAIVANGFSCQHQIREATGRSAVHIACLLQQTMIKETT